MMPVLRLGKFLNLLPSINMKTWFKPKCYGYGFGLPTAWQGWVSLLVLLALLLASAYSNGFFSEEVSLEQGLNFVVDAVIITGLFTVALKDKVEGGLKWRWGRKSL